LQLFYENPQKVELYKKKRMQKADDNVLNVAILQRCKYL